MGEKARRIGRVFLSFLKIGAFTFGGGIAMLPLIQKEAVEKRRWITDADLLDIVAISESTPGPIGINAATFVGFRAAGFWGALAATLGVVLPAFWIIFAVSFLLREFAGFRAVQLALRGLRAGALALMCKALWTMYRQCPKSALAYLLMAASFVLTAFCGVNVLLVILGCAALGLLSSALLARRARR